MTTSWLSICSNCGESYITGLVKCPKCGYNFHVAPKIKPSTTVQAKKHIRLDDIDGFEFEKLVADIFHSKGYYVTNIKPVGDEGRDVIIEKGTDRTLIECKHQKGTVGRPVIQKLHSAVIVDKKANSGLVITTGTFSNQAKKYVRNPNVRIELIDLPKFRQLAADVGIRLLIKGEHAEKAIYEINDLRFTYNNIINEMGNNVLSNPFNLNHLAKIYNNDITIIPSYRIEYKINHITSNSSGRILYQVNERGQMHIDSTNQKIYDEFSGYFSNSYMVNKSSQDRINTKNMPNYIYDETRLKNTVKNNLIKKHSKVIAYYGDNNVRYERECKILKKEIFLSNVTPVYLPLQKINFNVIKQSYFVNFVEKIGQKPLILNDNLNVCKECGNNINTKHLCNQCGAFTHIPKWWKRSSHSFICKKCGKTICRSCGYWKNKYLLFKEVLCEECAMKEASNTYTKIPPLK